MLTKEQALEVIYSAIDDVNEQLPKNSKIEKKEDSILFGNGGSLDSIGLVNFIVGVESLLDEKFDLIITLADEKAMSMNNSPFRSVQTIADYIILLSEGK